MRRQRGGVKGENGMVKRKRNDDAVRGKGDRRERWGEKEQKWINLALRERIHIPGVGNYIAPGRKTFILFVFVTS